VSAEPSGASEDNPVTQSAPLLPIAIDSDSDKDCHYFGGVNCDILDSEYDSCAESSGDDLESLEELEGDALDKNLHELQAEVESLGAAPSSYELITAPKSAKEWQRVEKNCSLGYTGTSTRTKQHKGKAAREQAVVQNKAKSS